MTNLTHLLLNGMTTYGVVVFGLALLLGALGTPIPTSLMVVAAGAFARQGIIDAPLAFGAGLAGTVAGDSLGYVLGRSTYRRLQTRWGRLPAWQTTIRRFKTCGGPTIYLSRFLLIPLAIPANLIAGGSGYGYRRFLAYDIAGEVTWLVLYGGLGYMVGVHWQQVTPMLTTYSTYLIGIALIGAITYILVRHRQRGQVVWQKLAPIQTLSS